jgi:ABC-type lipoprotein export system ATPase subunit
VILEGRDLEKTYEMGDRGLKVLRGVSVEVRRGEVLAIQGPSGAGKSTLLHLLGLLDEPDAGRILFRGEDLLALAPAERAQYRNANVGFVFQFYHLFPDLDALENVCLPKMVELSWGAYHAEKPAIEKRAIELLGMVGLAERMTHRPSELSGGERQRVAIARALMNEPEIVLCDEPTGNLDQKRAAEILDVIFKLNETTGQTFVVVTHDPEVARRAHRAIHVVDGVLAEAGATPAARGFADVKFRLRKPEPRGGWRLPAVPMGLLVAFVPFFDLIWLWLVQSRFQRATGRGHSPTLALFGHTVVPPVNLVVPFFIHRRPLRAANRLLIANGLEPIGGHWAPSLAWGAIWVTRTICALVMTAAAPGSFEALRSEHFALWMTLSASGVLLGVVAAWIQSLHNAFYDRMSPADAERPREIRPERGPHL